MDIDTQNELKKQYDLIREKAAELRVEYGIEQDPDAREKLMRQIEHAEKKRIELEHKLDEDNNSNGFLKRWFKK